MDQCTAQEDVPGAIFLAGERVAPGVYRRLDTGRDLVLECEDYLPASLDGRVASYARVETLWGRRSEERPSEWRAQ
jgi:hypothetical protein